MPQMILPFIILAYRQTSVGKVFFINNRASTLIFIRKNTIEHERRPYRNCTPTRGDAKIWQTLALNLFHAKLSN